MLKKLKFLMVLAAVFAVVGCKAEVESEYTITYDAAGHGTAPEAKTVEEGYKLTEEDLPALTADGFDFGGWKFNEKIVAAGEEVVSDMTLIAAWTEWGTVATPTFSVAAGEVDKGTKVKITCTTEGAVIYYTTDGSAPTADSTKYENEIEIIPPMTIKAFAVKSGLKNSGVASAEYTLKLYTVTFDANGHGTAPDAMKGYKGQTITLPAALTEDGWLFEKWNDGTADYDAGASYTVNGNITFIAKWKDVTPPANVTNLTAKCTASGTVKLTWENPTDADFAKVVITYEPGNGNVTVAKTASPNNETTVTELTNDTEYTFTVKAYDNSENASSGVSVNAKPVSFGGLQGTPTGGQTQGAVLKDTLKETWMAANGNLKVDGTEIAKTSEVVVVPTGTVATVTMPDDSSWSGYIEEAADSCFKGVFLKGRKVKLDPFVMSQYEVTEQLWAQVMGETETEAIKPKGYIEWYEACAFCNELTKKTMIESDCVYYRDENCNTTYTREDAINQLIPYIAYSIEDKKWRTKGYRLPTETEWEFAARGGDPNAKEWSYAYAGINSSGMVIDSTKGTQTNYEWGYLIKDDNLLEYAVYKYNGGSKANVGTKKANKLNLYDMSGNVVEWCYDTYEETLDSNDIKYKVGDYVQNPVVMWAPGNIIPCNRGGYYDTEPCYLHLSNRQGYYIDQGERHIKSEEVGFRLVRSTEVESN